MLLVGKDTVGENFCEIYVPRMLMVVVTPYLYRQRFYSRLY